MNLTEDLKTTLNKTLEIALGIEKINTMINPKQAHTDGKNLVNAIYKEINSLSNKSRNIKKFAVQKLTTTTNSASPRNSHSRPRAILKDFKKTFTNSIKNINLRVKMTRAGKKTIGQLLNDDLLPFNKSFSRTFSSRGNTPTPKSLPFVSMLTGRTEQSVELPKFQEYLDTKGTNYLKARYNDDIIGRFDKVATRIRQFSEGFDGKAYNYIKTIEEANKKLAFKKPTIIGLENGKLNSARMKSETGSPVRPKVRRERFIKTQTVFANSIQGFNQAKVQESQKFLDILNKIDLERPMNMREKVDLIQNDNERYRNHLHSLKKFQNFRVKLETTRRTRQSLNSKQGLAYMNIIEAFRVQRYKPCEGEFEILEFWKKMIGYGWVVTKNDLSEIREILRQKGINSPRSDALLDKFSKTMF